MFLKGLEFQYSRQHRAELLIAICRFLLATFSLLAVWLDPSDPSRYVQVAYALLCGYVAYSLLLTVLIFRVYRLVGKLPFLTHAFDLLLFTLFMFFTEGPNSPFFVYFVFSLFCATLRWSWQGTLWTSGIALMTFIGMGIYAGEIIHDPTFELNRFIIRSVYLAVVASLLSYLGVYEQRLREELYGLGVWPQIIPKQTQALVSEILHHAAGILRAPRMLLAWEEEEEPWIYFASWSRDNFYSCREPPDLFEPLVADPLKDTDFLCFNTCMPVPVVLHTLPTGLEHWHSEPLNPAFQTRFGIRAVLSLDLKGKGFKGRLFVLDKKRMTSDDLVLGRIVAHEMVVRLDYFYLLKQLQRSAAAEERVHMARDLHDGLLQSLTGAALQLETVRRLMESNPHEAQHRLLEIQNLIAGEQKDLRLQVQDLKSSPQSFSKVEFDLAIRLKELAEQVERHWGIRVEMRVKPLILNIPHPLMQEIYFIIHESLINAARHAHASNVKAELGVEDNRVNIIVSDDGHGFPFQGRYDHSTLTTLNLGPVTLKDRTAALGGSLNLESTDTGSCLEIVIPFTPVGG